MLEFNMYLRLKKLVKRSRSTNEYLNNIMAHLSWYGLPMWTKSNYIWMYNQIQAGHLYKDFQ